MSYKDPAAIDTTGISKMVVVYQYVINTLDEDKKPESDTMKIVLETLMHAQTIFTDNINGRIIGREAIGSKCFETEEAKTYQDWTLKNETEKVLGHKNYPQDPMMFVAPGGYREVRYGDVNDINVIDGVVVLDVAHKFQPLEY